MYSRDELDAHYDKIYHFCHYHLQHKELAEDITQETFLRYFKHKKYQAFDTPLKLLYTIARNLCIDESRKQKALPLNDLTADAEVTHAEAPPEDRLLTKHMLQLALSKLEPIEREIVFLRLVNQEPFAVIANTLQMSRYAIYRRYQHAIMLLRKEME